MRAALPCALLAVAASLLMFRGQTDAAETIQLLQARASLELEQPGIKQPFPCDDGWLASSRDNYVVAVMPWAAAAGLKPGDRFLEFNDVRAGSSEPWTKALAKIRRRQVLHIKVERSGREQVLDLPCRDNTESSRAQRAVFQNIANGDWEQCVTEATKLRQLMDSFSVSLFFLKECRYQQLKQRLTLILPSSYWFLVYEWATLKIQENQYHPRRLSVSQELLTTISNLERAGQKFLADDLRRHLANAPR